jgi:hypothetical protein
VSVLLNFTLSMNNQNSNTKITALIDRNHCRIASSRGGSAVQLPQDQTKREKLGGILSLSDQETNHARDKKKRSKQNLTRDQERRIVQRPASSRKKRKEIAVRTSLSSSGSAGQGRQSDGAPPPSPSPPLPRYLWQTVWYKQLVLLLQKLYYATDDASPGCSQVNVM